MIWNTHTNPQTHTHADAVVRQTRTHAQARAWGRATPSRQLMDVKQKWRGENFFFFNSQRGDHRLGTRLREKEEKKSRRECSSENKSVFIYQQWKGLAWEREQASDLRPKAPPPPCLRSPSHSFFLLPAVSLFSTHLTCSTSLLLLPKRVTLGRYFHFFSPSVHTVSIVVDGHSFMTA